MEFEFDSRKSEGNKEKHGIDFIEAQRLWDDPGAIAYPARTSDEPRYALVARLKDRIWIAFYTVRNDRVRLISVRRARTGERQLYES